jgi:glutathione S-transferase kappa 1
VALRRYKERWNLDVDLKPLVLGNVFKATKNVPTFARPWASATQKEGAQHLARNKQYFNLPMLDAASNFLDLARDLRYMRLLTAIKLRFPHVLEEATGLVFDLIWVSAEARDSQGRVMITEDLLVELCKKAGLSQGDAEAAVAAINEQSTKDAMKKSAEDCVAAGGFGAPFFRITNHGQADQPEAMIAFGSDRFEQLAFAMKKPWFGPDPQNPWQAKL